MVSYDEGYQYIFDTAIPLGELDENKSFKEQFQERKERADKERLTNAASKQDNKRKVNSEGEEAHKICWEEKVRGHKRVRADIDENKLTNILQIFYKDCDELNNDELKSLQQRLNDFFASKSKNIGEERCIS